MVSAEVLLADSMLFEAVYSGFGMTKPKLFSVSLIGFLIDDEEVVGLKLFDLATHEFLGKFFISSFCFRRFNETELVRGSLFSKDCFE